MAATIVRLAKVSDAESMAEIYNHEVTTGTATFDLVPRDVEDQRRWITERSGAYPAIVAERDGVVVGFGSLSRYRDRPAYATTVEDSVYVHGGHRGGGVGRALLDDLVSRAQDHGFHTVVARIAEGQEASVALHRACGFELVGVEREIGRKFGRWLDVVVMQRMLG